jgi:broad specificity phosphatase PhoE/8-oxo-dGTP pyrophosphatase MutT (NUDIX family)
MYTAPPPPDRSDTPQGLRELLGAIEPDPMGFVWKAGVTAAGLAVRAADTGRVLMIQRHSDAKDPAAGCWEFPGGCLNDGEHPYVGAKREWQEEMGVRLPRGNHVGQWQSGIYQGFVHEVPSEAAVKINGDRKVMNPDDPDGDRIEVAAWWDPEHMKRSRAVRQELHNSRAWDKVQKSGGTLYLISHAKTRYNRPGQPHDMIQGWRDIPIDNQGKEQARKLGKFLAGADIDEVYSSDLKRAKQTADIAARGAGLTVKADKKFRPWHLGSFAGHSSADVIPKLKPFMKEKADEPVDGGESFNTYKDRFIPALEGLLKRADGGKNIALFTHSRNVELAQGWCEGKGPRQKIDTQAIADDKIEPATVFEVTDRNKVKPVNISKAQARAATLHLRVNGVSKSPDGGNVYRMVTRDGHYVGRTNSTRLKARKGDVLKIQANDFARDAGGDYHWINPNVMSGYTDAAHSWKELEALAGGTLEKDFASGPAGQAPAAGDSPNGTSQMPSAGTLAAMTPAATSEVPAGSGTGPTLQAVHRNKPLKDLSVAYLNGPVDVRVYKADRKKQLVYGVVLEPNALDSQDDFMLPDQVEKAAHTYMKKVVRGKASVSKLQHRVQGFFKNKPGVVPVESYIAPCDFTLDGVEMVKKGTWVMCVHVEDPEIWNDVLKGEYTGFSIGGTGVRRSMHVSPDVPRGYITTQPHGWFNSNGGVAKAKPEDFERWRDHTWEGS